MALRVGINGFGRIGRLVYRVLAERPADFDIVAINDLSDPKHLALLLKYDSVQGRFKGSVEARREEHRREQQGDSDHDGKGSGRAAVEEARLSIALESTGRFTDRASLQKHLDAGAERVIFKRPGQRRTGRDDRAWCQ